MSPEKQTYCFDQYDIDPERICPLHPCYLATVPSRCFGNYKSCIVFSRNKTLRGHAESESSDVMIGEVERITKEM